MSGASLRGKALVADVDAAGAGPSFWWLGQQGFIVRAAGTVMYMDAYLADNAARREPPLLVPADVTNAHIVFGTHDHSDHVDRFAWPGIAAASPDALFVVPDLLLPGLSDELAIPAGRFIGMDDGKSVSVRGVNVTGVASAHEFLDRDGPSGRYPYLGYVVETAGFTVYHAGDTVKYEGLETKLMRWKFDLVFLPINGRDAARYSRNCIGNMTYQEAADLAGALRPGLTVPAHWDMFAANSEDPALFADYMRAKYPSLSTCVPEYGRRTAAGA
ncbi:MAG: MBL fold metallo-hydrolase [Planctomycetes bacterium]|nr:MBL fold metallo-hydrolase [Planctomycetota bacterium]